MWGKEAHVILQCVSCCLLLLPLLNFFTLLPVLTRFSRRAKASELLSFYKYCAISWDRNVCTGSEQMSSKCLHDNDHKKMVRKIIQEQSKWKIYKKYIFQYISPASGYHVTCFLHLIFINQFSLTSLPATGVIWSSLVRYDFLLWKIPPFIESVAHGQIFLVLFLVQRLDIIILRRRGEELFVPPLLSHSCYCCFVLPHQEEQSLLNLKKRCHYIPVQSCFVAFSMIFF